MKISLTQWKRDQARYEFTPAGDVGEIDPDCLMAPLDRAPKQYDEEELKRFAAELKDRGQLQPIHCYWSIEHHRYVIITGERRWRAAQLANMTRVLCRFVTHEMSTFETIAIRLADNLHRVNDDPLEIARGCRDMMNLKGWTAKQVAEELHVSPSVITKAMALLRLPEDVQEAVEAGELAPSTAYEVSRVRDADDQRKLAERAIEAGLSQREVCEKASAMNTRARKSTPPKARSNAAKRILRATNGCTVTVTAKRRLSDDAIVQACQEMIDLIRRGDRRDAA